MMPRPPRPRSKGSARCSVLCWHGGDNGVFASHSHSQIINLSVGRCPEQTQSEQAEATVVFCRTLTLGCANGTVAYRGSRYITRCPCLAASLIERSFSFPHLRY